MKRFTKTLLSVAAVSAVSAAMAVSAMAADMSASYAGDTVTLADVKSTGAQQTLLILDGAETVVENADGSNNIVQIDQKDDGTVFATTKVGTLKDGTYYVRIGGTDGTLQKYTLTVSSTSATTKVIVIGDANLDKTFTVADSTAVARKVAGFTTRIQQAGDKYKLADGSNAYIVIGDANLDKTFTVADSTAVARKVAGFTTRIQSAGNEVTVYEEKIVE